MLEAQVFFLSISSLLGPECQGIPQIQLQISREPKYAQQQGAAGCPWRGLKPPSSRPWARWGPCSGLAIVLGQPHEHCIRSTCVLQPVGLPSFPSATPFPPGPSSPDKVTLSQHTPTLSRRRWPTSHCDHPLAKPILESLSLLGSALISILVLEAGLVPRQDWLREISSWRFCHL